MACIASIHLPRSRSRYCSEPLLAFPWTEVSKAEQKATVGKAVPEVPLSVDSKLELLRALSLPNFRILPRTLPLLSAYAYCRLLYTMYSSGQKK